MSELWTKWEGQVVDGVFPLRRCLGVSDHSGVFLTEDPARNLANAALKLVPAIPTLAESQLAHWNAAAGLAHPRLLRLFSTGRCQLGTLHCLYVEMEYAEQNLAQFLANRALTEAEVLELLPPALEALAFLHSRNLVHGQLKPSNVLVVGDQLKLASDTVRPAGEAATSISMLSIYDPPEGRDGSFSTAGDIWALGVTLYEALTRTTPQRPDERSHGVVVPADFPPMCADVIRECLSRRPADRPGVTHLQAWAARAGGKAKSPPMPTIAPALDSQINTVVPAASQHPAPGLEGLPLTNELPGRLTIRAVVERDEPATPEPAPSRSYVPLAIGAVAVVAVGLGALRLFGTHSERAGSAKNQAVAPSVSASGSPENPAAAPPAPPAPSPQRAPGTSPGEGRAASSSTSPPAADTTATVVHEEIPKVPHSALATIHGHIRVTVRVAVDSTGAVVDESLSNPGPSRYFARVATQAARKWRFNPAADQHSREWWVHFEFSRSGTTAHAVSKS